MVNQQLFHLQSMNIQISIRQIWFSLIIILALTTLTAGKCQNSTDFRYDLQNPVEIINYNSLCFQHSKRTCCSPSNFELLTKKYQQYIQKRISKTIGPSIQLSLPCRRRLTSLMCSPCDGDIGQNQFDGVCSSFCSNLYNQCKNDLFSIDSTNQLKVCRDDDIICSPLVEIVAQKGQEYVCTLFDQRLSNRNCWNGQISAKIRGKAPRKVKIDIKKNPSKTQKTKPEEPWLSTSTMVYLLLVFLLASILIYQYSMKRYRLWKRQIKNL